MPLYKNKASQKIAVFAWDALANAPKTGDAGNITAQISKDGGACAATNDSNPTELDATDAPGVYLFDLAQAETNADLVVLFAKSSTSDVQLDPVMTYTMPEINVSSGAVDINLAQTNNSNNSATQVGGQLRRAHALVGGTKATKDHSAANPAWVTKNEADSAALVTRSRTVSDEVETITPT
jgi:hypothetical protein